MEHRPSTTPRHCTLFWAALAIPVLLVPCCFSSASVSCLQLLRSRPLFLFPCGFQAWRVMLDATSQQHASVSQGLICIGSCTCCNTQKLQIQLSISPYTDTEPTSPGADPITPGAWQGRYWSANFKVIGMTRPI